MLNKKVLSSRRNVRNDETVRRETGRVINAKKVKRTISVSKNDKCHCAGTTNVVVKVMGRNA